MSEHDEQAGFFDWIRANISYSKNKDLRAVFKLCFAIPNGASVQRGKDTDGQWNTYSSASKKLKSEGLTSGIPDIFFSFPAFQYAGLYIEMKFNSKLVSDNIQGKINDGNYTAKLRPEQKEMRLLLMEHGYRYVICYTASQAIETVISYLSFESSDYIKYI